MDVICEHCQAEYEFDETLLSDKGTTVKCSACGHVFRVLPPQRAGGRAPLVLHRAKGGQRELASLRELQQLIHDGQAHLDDEIGREGTPLRKLRDVPELKNFFSAAPPAESAASKVGPNQTLLGNSPTARPPEPYHDPAFPAPLAQVPKAPAVPRTGLAGEALSPVAARDKADPNAARTMAGMGPLSPPRPPIPGRSGPAYDGPGDVPAANESPAPRPSPRPEAHAIHAEAPTLLGAPAANLPKLEPAAALHTPRPSPQGAHTEGPRDAAASPRAEGLPGSSIPSPISSARAAPSPLPERAPPPASGLPRFELPGKPPDSKSPPAGRAWASAPPPSGPPAPASWAAKSAAPAIASPAPMRLHLPDDDAPPARVMRRGSRLWLVALLALVGVGGWIGVHALSSYGGEDVAVAPLPASTSNPPPASTETPPSTPPPAATAEPPKEAPASAAAADAKPTTPAAATPSEAAAPAASAKPADKPAAPATKPASGDKPGAKPAAPAEPERPKAEDYAQLIAKAAQLGKKGDQAGAIKAYQAALALRPSGSEANSGLGFALLKSNKTHEALPLLDRAAESGFVEANIGLGDAYRKLGQSSAATEAYRAYLEQQPDGPRAAYARTWLDKLGKGGGERPREEPAREEAPSAPAGDGYRPAGELMEPAPAQEAPPPAPPPSEAPAPEPNAEGNNP